MPPIIVAVSTAPIRNLNASCVGCHRMWYVAGADDVAAFRPVIGHTLTAIILVNDWYCDESRWQLMVPAMNTLALAANGSDVQLIVLRRMSYCK